MHYSTTMTDILPAPNISSVMSEIRTNSGLGQLQFPAVTLEAVGNATSLKSSSRDVRHFCLVIKCINNDLKCSANMRYIFVSCSITNGGCCSHRKRALKLPQADGMLQSRGESLLSIVVGHAILPFRVTTPAANFAAQPKWLQRDRLQWSTTALVNCRSGHRHRAEVVIKTMTGRVLSMRIRV